MPAGRRFRVSDRDQLAETAPGGFRELPQATSRARPAGDALSRTDAIMYPEADAVAVRTIGTPSLEHLRMLLPSVAGCDTVRI